MIEDTVIQVLDKTAKRRGDAAALRYKQNGSWQTITWRQYRDDVYRAARALIALGVEPMKGVAILGQNSPQWFITDLAAIAAGGLPAGIYVTNSPEQCHYIIEHSEARVVLADTQEQLDKIESIRAGLPDLQAIITLTGKGNREAGILTWKEFLELGDTVPQAKLDERLRAQKQDDPATLIYTSGTTGSPKAVLLCHRNLVWTAWATIQSLGIREDDELLSYLPLSHIAEQLVTLHLPIQAGCCSWFAESIEQLGENLREVRPTLFLGVPRVWEKIQSKIAAVGAQSGPIKRKISAWARSVGAEAGKAAQEGRPRPNAYKWADRLVFSKVRKKLGLDRARLCITSAAPIRLSTLEFFMSLGIPVYEVYGMSEVTGPTTVSSPEKFRLGTVGVTPPEAEVRISDDGEILIRGPHVFLGYYKDPQATAETLIDGWVHSGDLGSIDADGFIRITGRKKEIIITSGGHNIAPVAIEQKLGTIPGISQAVVIGDHRNYLVALLTLDRERLPAIATAAGSTASTSEEAGSCPKLHAYFNARIEEVNRTLAQAETVKKFTILARELNTASGEMTPTMKLRRSAIEAAYTTEIERMYDS